MTERRRSEVSQAALGFKSPDHEANHWGLAPEFPFDSGKQFALDVLADREVAPRLEIAERINAYEDEHGGDLWLDFFGPLMDKIEDALGYDRG